MKRLLSCLSLALFCVISSLGVPLLSGAADRPNIVMAFADDWGCHASAYGRLKPGGLDDLVSTPHFDSVAEQGVLFTRAFVSAPSCTPCRSSLLSGQHFWRCGSASILQGAEWDFDIPTYPLLLEAAGYRIGHTYKVWSPGTPIDAPHGGTARGFNRSGRKFNGFSQNAMKGDDPEARKAELLDEVRGNLLSFLDPNGDQKVDGEAPFCYFFGPTNCHRKWVAGSGKTLWGINPDDFAGKIPPYLPDVPVVREDFADYFGEIQAFDAGLGVIIDELKRLGVYDNTILVVSGDHGFPGVTRGKCNLYDFGTHVPLAIRWPAGMKKQGRVVDDFVSLPDLAPTFLEAAGVAIPDTMTAKSLIPVLASEKSGSVDASRDAVFTGRERHVASAQPDYTPYPQRAIRTDRHLLIINFAPERWPMGSGPGFGEPATKMPKLANWREDTGVGFRDMDGSPTKAWIVMHRDSNPELFDFAFARRPRVELYDVQKDPHWMNNLAEDPESQPIRQQLESRLMSELKRTADPRVSDNVIFESAEFTKPYVRTKKK
ncbi:sulfatase [Novipirellula caenicola]|uniref:Ulvan-active sulfatase n=1 Tax=Novipirellula caenicola TaxID=1536901 RepID=A0ABP9VUI6_9BACT